MRGHRDLTLVTGLAVICAVLALALPFEPLSAIVALPLILALPGYAIVSASFARRPLPGMHTALLSVALSLCALALGSIALDYLGGIHPGTWALLLVALVAALCRLAAIRRPQRGERPAALRLPQLPAPRLILYVAAAAITVVAIGISFVALPAKNALGHTELWISSQDEAGTSTVLVGVRSGEQRTTSYFLRVRIGERNEPTIRLFNLVPGETRQIRVTAPTPAERTPVTASLFRQSDPEAVYRRVYTWIPSQGP